MKLYLCYDGEGPTSVTIRARRLGRPALKVKLSLPASWRTQPARRLLTFFVAQYNAKHAVTPIAADELYLMRGAAVLRLDDTVEAQLDDHNDVTVAHLGPQASVDDALLAPVDGRAPVVDDRDGAEPRPQLPKDQWQDATLPRPRVQAAPKRSLSSRDVTTAARAASWFAVAAAVRPSRSAMPVATCHINASVTNASPNPRRHRPNPSGSGALVSAAASGTTPAPHGPRGNAVTTRWATCPTRRRASGTGNAAPITGR